jgi:hypothetical protein
MEDMKEEWLSGVENRVLSEVFGSQTADVAGDRR